MFIIILDLSLSISSKQIGRYLLRIIKKPTPHKIFYYPVTFGQFLFSRDEFFFLFREADKLIKSFLVDMWIFL